MNLHFVDGQVFGPVNWVHEMQLIWKCSSLGIYIACSWLVWDVILVIVYLCREGRRRLNELWYYARWRGWDNLYTVFRQVFLVIYESFHIKPNSFWPSCHRFLLNFLLALYKQKIHVQLIFLSSQSIILVVKNIKIYRKVRARSCISWNNSNFLYHRNSILVSF